MLLMCITKSTYYDVHTSKLNTFLTNPTEKDILLCANPKNASTAGLHFLNHQYNQLFPPLKTF